MSTEQLNFKQKILHSDVIYLSDDDEEEVDAVADEGNPENNTAEQTDKYEEPINLELHTNKISRLNGCECFCHYTRMEDNYLSFLDTESIKRVNLKTVFNNRLYLEEKHSSEHLVVCSNCVSLSCMFPSYQISLNFLPYNDIADYSNLQLEFIRKKCSLIKDLDFNDYISKLKKCFIIYEMYNITKRFYSRNEIDKIPKDISQQFKVDRLCSFVLFTALQRKFDFMTQININEFFQIVVYHLVKVLKMENVYFKTYYVNIGFHGLQPLIDSSMSAIQEKRTFPKKESNLSPMFLADLNLYTVNRCYKLFLNNDVFNNSYNDFLVVQLNEKDRLKHISPILKQIDKGVIVGQDYFDNYKLILHFVIKHDRSLPAVTSFSFARSLNLTAVR